jgi:hypothetical protein
MGLWGGHGCQKKKLSFLIFNFSFLVFNFQKNYFFN